MEDASILGGDIARTANQLTKVFGEDTLHAGPCRHSKHHLAHFVLQQARKIESSIKKMLNKKTERKRLDGKKPNEPYFVRTKKAFLNDVFHNNEGKLHHENRRMRFIIRSEE